MHLCICDRELTFFQREFYYHFGSPILKVFLGALFTYELLLYGWLKLESVELAAQNNGEWSC